MAQFRCTLSSGLFGRNRLIIKSLQLIWRLARHLLWRKLHVGTADEKESP